jgi:DNA repair protein RecO (recombination protein O)
VFLTRDRGKKRGVAKNARQSRRRFGGGLEPMTCGRVAYVERERRDLVLLNYVEPTRSPLAAIDGDALGYVEYFAELLDECAPEADPNETLFRLGASMPEAMAAGVSPEPLARYFEYWLLRVQGVFRPDPKLSGDARAFLELARTSSPVALKDHRFGQSVLRELETAHRTQLVMHLEKELKSARVLREMRR